MFAPPVAKPKSAAGLTNKSALEHSALAGQRFGRGAFEQRASLTGNEPGAHAQEAEAASTAAREAAPGPSWDFSKIPIFPPGGTNQPQDLFPFGGPRLPGPIQAKLAIGKVDDPLEHEADRVADHVMRMPAPEAAVTAAPPQLSRKCDACEEEEKLQKKPAGPQAAAGEAPAIVHEVLRSPGQPLDAATRAFFEPRFGHDFSRARVHSGDQAEASARAVQARAFTLGQHLVFGRGEYAPSSEGGRELLAHELAHFVQQSGSSPPAAGGEVGARLGWQPVAVSPMIQRDLAIEPPRPEAVGRVLTAPQMASAIALNNKVLGAIPDSADIIEEVRNVIGVSPLPAVVDEDFVNGVVQWQASFGLVQDGKLGPATARPLFREIGAEKVGHGEVSAGPRYNPAGPINVAGAPPRQANFDLIADFRSDPPNQVFPSCCEIRQDIQWDAAFVAAAAAAGNPIVPHAGFPAARPANTWTEDRDQAGGRFGHRTGPFSDPQPFDQYVDTAGHRNQAFGHRYRGHDTPEGLAADRGSWRFRLKVIDVCNGDKQLAVSPTLLVNWL